jgi:hypothetical protein
VAFLGEERPRVEKSIRAALSALGPGALTRCYDKREGERTSVDGLSACPPRKRGDDTGGGEAVGRCVAEMLIISTTKGLF